MSFWMESEERRLEARKRLRRWRVRTVDHALVSGICLWEVELGAWWVWYGRTLCANGLDVAV